MQTIGRGLRLPFGRATGNEDIDEAQRLRQRRMEREAKERERLVELYEDCDDRFVFIAGYTDGGAPFGVMWEEVGIDPGLSFEEKMRLYHMQMLG